MYQRLFGSKVLPALTGGAYSAPTDMLAVQLGIGGRVVPNQKQKSGGATDTEIHTKRACMYSGVVPGEGVEMKLSTTNFWFTKIFFLPSFFFICSINSVQYNMQLYNDEQDNKAKALTAALYKM